MENQLLETPFVEKEIKGAVWDSDGNNNLGLDEFNFSFITDIKFYGS